MSGNIAAEAWQRRRGPLQPHDGLWMMPLMSLWIGFTLPAALGVYWIINSLLYAIRKGSDQVL